MVSNFDKGRFRFTELFNNNNGKSSGSGAAGLFIVFIGGLSFIASMVGYYLQLPNTLEVMSSIVIFIGIGATLLGVRKLKKEPEEPNV